MIIVDYQNSYYLDAHGICGLLIQYMNEVQKFFQGCTLSVWCGWSCEQREQHTLVHGPLVGVYNVLMARMSLGDLQIRLLRVAQAVSLRMPTMGHPLSRLSVVTWTRLPSLWLPACFSTDRKSDVIVAECYTWPFVNSLCPRLI